MTDTSEKIPPRYLTDFERHSLALQHRGLAALAEYLNDHASAQDHHRRATALEQGFVIEYNREFETIAPEVPEHDLELVVRMFALQGDLDDSVAGLSDSELEGLGHDAAQRLQFRGFHPGEYRERRMLDYARHLLDSGDWPELASYFDAEHQHGESTTRTAELYARMVSELRGILIDRGLDPEAGYVGRFSVNELRRLLDAQTPRAQR